MTNWLSQRNLTLNFISTSPSDLRRGCICTQGVTSLVPLGSMVPVRASSGALGRCPRLWLPFFLNWVSIPPRELKDKTIASHMTLAAPPYLQLWRMSVPGSQLPVHLLILSPLWASCEMSWGSFHDKIWLQSVFTPFLSQKKREKEIT